MLKARERKRRLRDHSARGDACCKRLFGRSTARASRVPASIPSWPYARTVSVAIGRSASNYIMKRRTNNDKDRSVAQESARNGSLRAGWCREPAGTGKCQRIGRAELNERRGSPEVAPSLGEERLGPSGSPARRKLHLYKRG